MKTLEVDLGDRSYPIHVGPGLMARADLYAPHLRGDQVLIVTNETVGPLYEAKLRDALPGRTVHTHVLPDGESHKTLANVEAILDTLLRERFARDCTVVALGGGVVGDMGGFAAACYQRGVAFIQVPTTLLAQVDSSVGGKTGVNHPLGKNMIGAFHQPVCVVADTTVLSSLGPREVRAGLAEVIKYGLIRDGEFFEWLEAHLDDLLAGDEQALTYAVYRSCIDKAEIVAADEREGGIRALLNLGHTFGHAIEAGLGYGEWLHGEAVGAGMVLAADLSVRIGLMNGQDRERGDRLIARAGLPVRTPASLTPERMVELMALDKKVLGGQIRLILLRAIGDAIVTDDFDASALDATLAHGREAA